jgi:hypothetical protein
MAIQTIQAGWQASVCTWAYDGRIRLPRGRKGEFGCPDDALTFMYDALITTYDGSGHKFTGKERDSESGLDYFGARYYSSRMGR